MSSIRTGKQTPPAANSQIETQISELGADNLQDIFSRLPLKTVKGNAGVVCRDWRTAAQSPLLFKRDAKAWTCDLKSIHARANTDTSSVAGLRNAFVLQSAMKSAAANLISHVTFNRLEIASIALHGDTVVTGANIHGQCVWSKTSGELLHQLRGPHHPLVAVSGDVIVTGGGHENACIWSASTGQLLHTLDHTHNQVFSVAIEGDTVVTGSAGHTARVWSTTTGQMLLKIDHGEQHDVTAVAIAHDRIVTGCGNTVYIWSKATGELQRKLPGYHSRIISISISGDTVVTGADAARVWSLKTGKLLHELDKRGRGVKLGTESVSVAVGGNIVVTGSDALRVWSRKTGELLQTHERSQLYHSEYLPAPLLATAPISSIAMDGDSVAFVYPKIMGKDANCAEILQAGSADLASHP